MGDCKRITATAKELVVNVGDGAKTAVASFKEISINLKTVSLATEAPQPFFKVELKGFGEGYISDPSLFRYNEDDAQISEVFSKSFGTRFTELSSVAEVLRINASKVFTEFQTASDNLFLVANWVRQIDDQFASGDILSASFGKILSDQGASADTVAKSVATPFSDSNSITDVVASVLQATKQDAFATSDSVTFSAEFRRVIQDRTHSTYGYCASDYAQEDYLLNPPRHDIITLNIGKGVDDIGVTTDTITNEASFYRSLADAATSANITLIAISKELNNDIAPIEAIAKSAGVFLADSAEAPDVLRKSLAASKADAAGMSDACTANLQSYMSGLYVNTGYIGINYTL